ncbi:hypothetical protein COH20_011392 [Aspergillus flavus]|nr:hypothetical protein COH20_011392 [Aspergillus flavus]RAQ71131.1 hypothetical protein COH21_008775 [Aspergillus flavus]
MEPQQSIAIIGAGPSGLVYARLLESGGITDYVIYKRDELATPGPWQQGGTLDLHGPSGQLALKRASLFDKSSARISPAGRLPAYILSTRELLLDSVPAHKIRWGHAVSTIERNTDSPQATGDNGCIIRFVNGTSATGFRLIVGADGAWSKVRPLLTSAKPVYSGKKFIEGSLSHDNPNYKIATEMVGPGNMEALGNGIKMAVQQVSNGTYRVYFGFPVPEDIYHHRQPSTVTSTEPTSKTDATAEGPFRAWPLYRMEPESVGWDRGVAPGVILLGDAAHLSTPFAGEGVNCSMYDAVVLADRIIEGCGNNAGLAIMKDTELETVLALYEEDMFQRGRDLIQRSTKSETMLFAQDAAAQFQKVFK